MYFLSVGDFFPPPPPPLDDPGTLPPGSGHFPPPPPLDEGAFKVQVRAVAEVGFVKTFEDAWEFSDRCSVDELYPESIEDFATYKELPYWLTL